MYLEAVILIAAMIFMSPPAPQVDGSSRTVLDGVYTAAQADKGEKEYEKNCVRCHEGNDPEGPTLIGRTFVERWREDQLEVLFHYMKSRMPADEPGTLADSEYLEVLTYLLAANSYRYGTQELTLEKLPSIRIVGPDGPRPLPTNTLVVLVGCLAADSAGDWTLARATEPVRSRQGKESSAEELKEGRAKPLGPNTFRLQNFQNIALDFKPDAHQGQKILVKGVLIRQTSGERISVTSLETLAPACGPSIGGNHPASLVLVPRTDARHPSLSKEGSFGMLAPTPLLA